MSEGAAQTPITDLLRSVPADARMTYEHSPWAHSLIPVGRLCADALAYIERIERERDELEQKADRILENAVSVLQGDCGVDHSKADIEDFRGCTICQRARIAELECERDDALFRTSGLRYYEERDHYRERAHRAEKRIAGLEAENARLREVRGEQA